MQTYKEFTEVFIFIILLVRWPRILSRCHFASSLLIVFFLSKLSHSASPDTECLLQLKCSCSLWCCITGLWMEMFLPLPQYNSLPWHWSCSSPSKVICVFGNTVVDWPSVAYLWEMPLKFGVIVRPNICFCCGMYVQWTKQTRKQKWLINKNIF